ncbi:hypothetical protein WJX75_000108 [Coccomyxa subellipsoidea]|uniref:Bifunctional inhibitor/plant lipid transfer protein/seed storage helical domain-containing protein n=1 Tax=Coccomyxa subellipsoidea TaxID=248742 RepID=A0ABR2YCX1_9CHLO
MNIAPVNVDPPPIDPPPVDPPPRILAPINVSTAACEGIRGQFYTVCQGFVVRCVTDGRAGNLTTATVGDMQYEERSVDPKPGVACCSCLKDYLMNGCRCDGNDEAASRSIGIPPGGLKAAVVYMSAACKLPLTMDAAPPVCPADPMVAAAEPDPTVTAQSVAG